jgi:hypothetical protein
MHWMLGLCLLMGLGACTAPPLLVSPTLETELRTLVRTRCRPVAPVLPRATVTPAETARPQEVG